jgi:hypothetical protein
MKKKHLLEALEKFHDDDHIVIGDDVCSYVPEIRRVCGGRQYYMGYYCAKEKGHSGKCWCINKNVNFDAEILD